MRSRSGAALRLVAAALLAACSGDSSGPPVPSAITSVSGSGQSGVVGAALLQPVVVRVTDAKNKPISGIQVSFNVATGGGSIGPASATTDASGVAQTNWTLGTNASQEQRIEARAAGLTTAVSFTATAQPGPAAALTKAGGDGQSGPVGAALSTELAVRVADQYGNAVNGATVNWTVASGGGALNPTISQSGADGVARTRWTLGGTMAGQSVSASVGSVPAVLFTASGTAGAVASIVIDPINATIGVGQTRQFTATMRDAFNNAITGRPVTWSVQDQTVASIDANGLARGLAAGITQITAAAEGRTATGALTVQTGPVLSPVIASVSPSLLMAGGTATITGANFAATAAGNVVTINGLATTVTAATTTELTIRVPDRTALGCEPTRSLNVVVNVGGNTGSRTASIATGTQRNLARGEVLTLTGDDVRCNELALGSGRYVVSVANASPDANGSSGFALRGAAAVAGLSTEPAMITNARLSLQQRTLTDAQLQARREAAAHHRVLDNNINLISSMPRFSRAPEGINNLSVSAVAPPPNVGDTLTIKMANPTALSCNASSATDIRARVVFVGTRGVVLEDVAAPLAGTMDSLYAVVGNEFDNVMYPILSTNYGDPLQFDASLDNNQRFYMVFSKRVNDTEGIAGYVLSTDFYPRTLCGTSNQAEIFYARVPTLAGTGFNGDTRDTWLRRTRTVIIHEVKHIVSFANRFVRTNGNPTSNDFEHRWLEESSAMLAEELWARTVFGYAQRGNVNYRTSIYCEVRPTTQECLGKPRSLFDHFFLLHDYESEIEIRSPLGPTASDDFTYYGSGWAFLRWAIDHYSTSESAFLRALTTETSLRGSANLAARAGRPIEEMIADFSMALALDDRAGFSNMRPQHTMPSWNVPDIFTSLETDFPGSFAGSPLAKRNVSYGDFNIAVNTLRGGSSAVFELSGNQTGKQLLELRGSTGGAPATNLRIAIVRVE